MSKKLSEGNASSKKRKRKEKENKSQEFRLLKNCKMTK